ncbi:hypothetical protein BCD96_001710 [Clostridium beijerinckii]|nr:hypothetical protein [Clostridium beijerinckii]NRU39904.1 hypothetical protein [Clostridium beijerinckii]NSA96817.1 hypothetical protein [Clostridium beijerinckii]OOM62568.1 hypothetical protein CLOBI_21790 [Clostridium beijerinckii]OOM64892.1 hypothetical protein CLBEIC_54120 [Clostridium beijerinckii]
MLNFNDPEDRLIVALFIFSYIIALIFAAN